MNPNVLVVGAGPVGLTMAAELARYGLSVRIIDKGAHRTDKSKALVIWSRTLELIDRMGCSESFITAGFKVTAANIIAGSKQIAHFRIDTIQTPHPYALMLPQSETERLMEGHLNTFGVQVERQVELTRFTPGTDKVTATLLHPDGREETLDTPWLIGCDGAHSAVRHGLNMQFEGDTLPSDWILADVHLDGVRSKPDELDIFWHPEGALVFFPISPGRYRVIADVGDGHGGTHRPDPTIEEVQAMLDRRGPGGIQASSPIWLASFQINERKVADYRAGRVFLAGDAAHVHSPAGGQGMNTGMQDACNLAWKLALVQSGLAQPEPLLGSYSTERSAVGRQVLTDAGRLTMLAILRGGVVQSIRNHVASLVFGLSPVRTTMANKLSELSIGYPKSPLTQTNQHHHPDPAPGDRAPILDAASPVGAGKMPRFALFAETDVGNALIERHPDLLEQKIRPPFAEGNLWLVRPDGYVAMVAERREWNTVNTYLRQVAGYPNDDALWRATSQ
jgi:2-polyprenyl-6-methoxyphenol hydroxylase-like FAD-dependent oxidoreductase